MRTQRTYTIGELSQEFQTTTRTIRYYEQCGLLSPQRVGKNRIYLERERVRLALIMRGRRLGFRLVAIKEMLDLYDIDHSQREQLVRTLQYGRQKIAHLERQKQEIEDTLGELKAYEQHLSGLLQALLAERPEPSPEVRSR
ncbi:MAG: MerR family transcriptional regulator [Sulfobacillus sp.]